MGQCVFVVNMNLLLLLSLSPCLQVYDLIHINKLRLFLILLRLKVFSMGSREREPDVDCIVVGGGVAGLSAAEVLKKAGIRCLICHVIGPFI